MRRPERLNSLEKKTIWGESRKGGKALERGSRRGLGAKNLQRAGSVAGSASPADKKRTQSEEERSKQETRVGSTTRRDFSCKSNNRRGGSGFREGEKSDLEAGPSRPGNRKSRGSKKRLPARMQKTVTMKTWQPVRMGGGRSVNCNKEVLAQARRSVSQEAVLEGRSGSQDKQRGAPEFHKSEKRERPPRHQGKGGAEISL